MSNVTGMWTGATLLAMGGVGGWCLRTPANSSAKVHAEDGRAEAIELEVASLRGELRSALERTSAAPTLAAAMPNERVDASPLEPLERKYDELVRRVDALITAAAPLKRSSVAVLPGSPGSPRAGFSSCAEIYGLAASVRARASLELTDDKRWISETEAAGEFRHLLADAHYFWRFEDVIDRYGVPEGFVLRDGTLLVTYGHPGDEASCELEFHIVAERVVDVMWR